MREDAGIHATDATINSLLRSALARGKTTRLRVVSGSMWPAIRIGDEIELKACEWTALRAGDVIVYERKGILQVHRFLRVKKVGGEPRLVTKGDAGWDFDSPAPVDWLLGRVERVERNGQGHDLIGGRPRLYARWKAVASIVKARIGQLYRQMKQRAGLTFVLGMGLSALWATSASAAVTVASFDATGGQGRIVLSWMTAMELNNFGFNIERSTNPADPSSFAKIAFVSSQSPCMQSLMSANYSYTDDNLPAGAKYYYRLQLFGSPCGDPNVYHETIVSAVSASNAAATPTATRVPPTATVVPTATKTPVPSATATPVPPTYTPIGAPSNTPTEVLAVPSVGAPPLVATATVAPVPTDMPATPESADRSATPEPTITIVAIVVPTTAASAPRINPAAQRKPTPTEPAVAASPSPALVGVGLLAVLGMGMAGFGLLAIAGIVLWQYHLRR